MRKRIPAVLVGSTLLLPLVGGSVLAEAAADKNTLVIALDSLGAQVMDPIAETRAPHAHYHAPLWDSLVGFDLEKGGIGPGVAEHWKRSADGRSPLLRARPPSGAVESIEVVDQQETVVFDPPSGPSFTRYPICNRSTVAVRN